MKLNSFLSLITAMLISTLVVAQKDAKLLRFPDINKGLVAFVYAGDIWTVGTEGGDAKRLTSHLGMELFPKISPDGRWIAFSAEYSGDRQVYIIPSEGGSPKQLTYYNSVGEMPPRGGFDYVILDWTSDSKNILIRANRTPYGERNGKYFLVNIDGGMEKELAIPEGGFGVFNPDNTKMCFAQISREFRTWKRYKGGRASDLWIYDLEQNHSEKITDFVGTDQIPTWYGNKIYFASDRDLRLNLYSYDITTKETKQITTHQEFDVMWPSGEHGAIVYEMGGELFRLDLLSEQTKKIPVNIHFDNPNTLPSYKKVDKWIHSLAISPTGKRALIDARGDVFSVPAENGSTINLTNTQGIREIYPSWSPNGRYISYASDESGEYEIYLLENKENAKPKQLTKGSAAWKYASIWSPDSKYLVYFDRTLQLKLLDVEKGKEKVISKASSNEIRQYNFSPDSKWLTYTKDGQNQQSAIWVYSLEKNKEYQLTDDTFNDMSPVFSSCGNYLFFLSNRTFNLSFSEFEFNYLYNDATNIYAIVLKENGPKLFQEKNDIEPIKEENEEKNKSNKKELINENTTISIDFEGINQRIIAFPFKTENYRNLTAVKDGILYLKEGELHKYSLTKEKDELIMKNIRYFLLSQDETHFLYQSGRNYGIAKLSPGQKDGSGKLNLSDLEMKVDPRKEWNQIYIDGWRIFRDYFYVNNLHNVNWKKIRKDYGSLLPYVGHRADLDYILSEIISETNTGHSYVNYGDFERVKRIQTGLLGAKIKADVSSGKYIISKIFQGENWNPSRRSPLTEQGISVNEGDYLLAINGNELDLKTNPYKYLENTVGKVVEITVNSKPESEGAKTYRIKPISSETELMYFDHTEYLRKMVDKLSNGRIGYIHVPNTAVEGNRELHRGMYAYHNKEALIIDDRYNGGGFIPDQMADLLDRKTLSYWHRNGLEPNKTPAIAHDGPKVMLINHYSSSGGDALPYYFKKKGLGKLIGTRTWGGLVGMSGNASLVDGGYIAVPRFGIFDENEEWIIEGIGVYPDIEVIDYPHMIAKGIDPSIERAVKELLEELDKNPAKKVKSPNPPDRSKWIEQEIN